MWEVLFTDEDEKPYNARESIFDTIFVIQKRCMYVRFWNAFMILSLVTGYFMGFECKKVS